MDQLFDPKDHKSDGRRMAAMATKTTIEAVLNLSPIPKTSSKDMSSEDMSQDMSCESVYDWDSDLSFDKSKSSRKYCSIDKWVHFSPTMRSTPKASKTRRSRRTRVANKCNKHDVSLWDKAIHKNPELKQWIHSFNEDMEKIESSELSVIQSPNSAKH
ncbi:unnamed protein product [Medioppia subpectinata]|uniref:Uncharacterized protein n=1 Tax=Medioppia subpectinata TaxID=1979941 RepID=A0A7R9KI84_9ACAR|nr:unnamed protein product [Medioppia subpectinata]CAG2103835.1 unnamed protein product [Medioppia subpectinata]